MKPHQEASGLISIADLKKQDWRSMLKEVTLVNRIDSLLEDMNVEPITLNGEFRVGDLGRRTKIFHASAIGSCTGSAVGGKYIMACARELYYSYVGTENGQSWEPRIRRTLDTGTVIHSLLQLYLSAIAERSGGEETFESEMDVNPTNCDLAKKYNISGHADGIYTINNPDIHVRFGVEIKSINEVGYKGLNRPIKGHMAQATVYQACLDLPIMLFLYFNKNTGAMAEFIHVFDRELWEAIVVKLTTIRSQIKKGELPQQEASYLCSMCRFMNICKPPKRLQPPPGHLNMEFRKATP